MTRLRSKIIRLAHRRPDLRHLLLGALKEAATQPSYVSENLGRVFQKMDSSSRYWFVPTKETKSGAIGVLVRWENGDKKPLKGVQETFSERSLLNDWKETPTKDAPEEVLEKLREKKALR